MTEKHLIMGTAGHIDHGKTSLIKVLTGFDCDTHKEEKNRGITIHLGFSHLDISNDLTIGIVDVPGHAEFIKTMVAGACAIDFALLVVAADSGVMPQTLEHLQIMEVLGVRSCLVAITKTDLVDQDIIDMAVEEARDLCEGTSFEGCTIVPVSAKNNKGIDKLKNAIIYQAKHLKKRDYKELFRLYIDRIFSVKGFGTIVTGSVMSGTLTVGDKAFLLPENKAVRVRRLERHGSEVKQIYQGNRASLNLVGLDVSEYSRGMIVSDRPLRSTTLVDAKMRLFKHAKTFSTWTQSLFYLGTYVSQVRIHLIDSDSLDGEECALVQIHLPNPCVAQAGDRFVLRSTSSDITYGGGEIIDPFPLHHRRRPEKLIHKMQKLSDGDPAELIADLINRHVTPLDSCNIAEMLNISQEEVCLVIKSREDNAISLLQEDNEIYFMNTSIYEIWKEKAIESIDNYHKRSPIDSGGRTISAIAGTLKVAGDKESEAIISIMLRKFVNDGILKNVNDTFANINHKVFIEPKMEQNIADINAFFKDSALNVLPQSKIDEKVKQLNIDNVTLNQILRYLLASKKLYNIEGNFVHASVIDECRKKTINALRSNKDGMTVAQLRDYLGANRKLSLLLFALFDKEKTTERQGNVRFLKKG